MADRGFLIVTSTFWRGQIRVNERSRLCVARLRCLDIDLTLCITLMPSFTNRESWPFSSRLTTAGTSQSVQAMHVSLCGAYRNIFSSAKLRLQILLHPNRNCCRFPKFASPFFAEGQRRKSCKQLGRACKLSALHDTRHRSCNLPTAWFCANFAARTHDAWRSASPTYKIGELLD